MFEKVTSTADSPRQTIGSSTGLDMPRYRKRLEVDDRDIVIRATCDERSRTIGLDQNATGAMTDGDALHHPARARIQNDSSGPLDTRTRFPSGVNLSLFPPRTLAASV